MKKNIFLLAIGFLALTSYSQVTYSKDGYGNNVETDQYGNILATYTVDGYGNSVKEDKNGNILVVYSKDSYGNKVEKDRYGNIIATYSIDAAYGEYVKKDKNGNILIIYSKDGYGNNIETDKNGKILATYSKDGYGNIIKTDQYGNIISKGFNDMNGMNYDNSRPPRNYGKYIDPLNGDLIEETLQHLENKNNKGSYSSSYDNSRKYVNKMLYTYDYKYLEKSKKTQKSNKELSKKIGEDLSKKLLSGKLYYVDSLENGWYEIVSLSDAGEYSIRNIEVNNHNVVSWVNLNNVKFNTSDLNNFYEKYSLNLNLPDGGKSKVNFYFTNNNPLKKNPKFYEGAVYIFYAKEYLDGGSLFVRIVGEDVNELRGVESYWNSTSNPKCNDKDNIIKFYLPKDCKFEFHANTQTKFWKGEINTNSYCKSTVLGG